VTRAILASGAFLAAVLAGGALACAPAPTGVAQTEDVRIIATEEAGSEPSPDGGADANPAAVQIDRAARPLVTALLVPVELLDPYNSEPSFDGELPRILQGGLESRLAFFDTIAIGDGGADPVDWPVPDGGSHPLLPMFVADVLLVDTALPCAALDGGFVASYLDLEREIFLSGSPHRTCGGRTPSQNIVDATLSLLVTGDRQGAPTVSQGVAAPTRPATTVFPYLADPN
jgi:hypothetical protein